MNNTCIPYYVRTRRFSRGVRRKQDAAKASRKRAIDRARHIDGGDWYNNLHQYSKGKIHCSCPMCAAKTNDAAHKKGGSKHWGMSDLRKHAVMDAKEKEYAEYAAM